MKEAGNLAVFFYPGDHNVQWSENLRFTIVHFGTETAHVDTVAECVEGCLFLVLSEAFVATSLICSPFIVLESPSNFL